MPKFPLSRALTRSVVTVGVALCCVLVGATSAFGAIETDDLVAVFQRGMHVYVDESAEPVNEASLAASVENAEAMGYDLYIAILGPDSAGVDNTQVREALDDATVATWMPDAYRISSDDICREALNRADQQAKANVSISYPPDEFMAAFVAALDTTREACSGGFLSGGSSGSLPGWLRFLLIAVAIAAVALLIAWLYTRTQARAAETRRAEEFQERRKILKDWGDTLRDPIDELRDPVKASGNAEYQEMFDDAEKVAGNANEDIDSARALPDLDRAEIRIARAQMRIRDLYEALPDVSR